MLITTSRKPSQRTRSFCKSLVRVFYSSYINRGKMSIRDVLIKSSELDFDKIAVISELKGNPNRIDFYDLNGELIFSVELTVGIPNSNANSKSRVKTENLRIQSEVDELYELGNIMGIPKFKEGFAPENLIVIKQGDENNRAIIEFYGSNGIVTGPKMFIKSWSK